MLSLLCNNFNKAYSTTLIPSIKYPFGIAGMICFCSAIRVKVFPGMQIIFFVNAVFIFLSMIVLANVISIVWSTSDDFAAQARDIIARIHQLERRILLKKLVVSLIPLRVCIGRLYYMEREAKLTFIQFLVNGSVNILLTFK